MSQIKIHTVVFHVPPQDETLSEEELLNAIRGIAEKLGIKPQPPRSATSYTLSTGEVLDAHQIAQLSDKLLQRSREKLLQVLHRHKTDHVTSEISPQILICADPDFIAVGPSIPNPDGFQHLTCTCNGEMDCDTCPIQLHLRRIHEEVRGELNIN